MQASAVGTTESSTVTAYAWYNMQPLHGAPQSLNLLDNAILQQHVNDNTYGIYTYNCPLPKSASDQINDLVRA